MKRTDRHGRGLRGPLAAPNPFTITAVAVPSPPRGAALFAQALRTAVARGEAACPRAFFGVEIGFEDIPTSLNSWSSDRVPLAAATSAAPGQGARVVLFRRPIEHRCANPAELRQLVHRTLIEQLSALTGIGVDELAPDVDLGDWD